MELAIALGWGGWVVVLVAALVFGVAAQLIGETRTGYEWLVDGVAFALGAVIASEFVVGWRAIEPVWDGLALLPAVIGGLVLGVLVEIITRYLTGGRYTTHHRPTAA
jgi:uncharacterized membrane protein YeaQ/YmgE (transglycosylase-associated protein family)